MALVVKQQTQNSTAYFPADRACTQQVDGELRVICEYGAQKDVLMLGTVTVYSDTGHLVGVHELP